MRKIEEFLKIASDSSRMPGWNDGLSYILGKENSAIKELTDEELDMVAGGIAAAKDTDKQNLKK